MSLAHSVNELLHSCIRRAKASPRQIADILTYLCVCLLLVSLAGCSEEVNLQTGLTDSDANEIVSVLNRNGIEVNKHTSKDGVTLTVKDTDISRATDVMHGAGLPRRPLTNLGQVFKKEGMISTPLEERVRYIHGLSQELERTLEQFDNIVSARVHVVLPERIAPGEPIQPSSAAVFIKYRPPFDEDATVPRIRSMVASSIPGLAGEEGRSKVSVVLAPTAVVSPGIEWARVGPFIVTAKSATALTATLVSLVALVACSLVTAIAIILKPAVADMIRKRVHKVAVRKRGSDDENRNAPEPEQEVT